MRHFVLWALVCAMLSIGCGSKGDPPCPPGAREVWQQEADNALADKARRVEEEAKKLEADGKQTEADELRRQRGATLQCGYDLKPDGTYRKADFVYLPIGDILACVTDAAFSSVTLSECMVALARAKFAGSIVGQSTRAMLQVTSKIVCLEFSREVQVNADKHGLQRSGPWDWVGVTIYAVIRAASNIPAPAPALFLITPKSGGEEACVDPTADAPTRRCTAADGCPDRPAGAEGTDAGGVSLPPGTTPGDGKSSGDYP